MKPTADCVPRRDANVGVPRRCGSDRSASPRLVLWNCHAVGSDGTVVHGTLTIGGAMIIIQGEGPTLASRVLLSDGSSSVVIFVYVEKVDSVIERAR